MGLTGEATLGPARDAVAGLTRWAGWLPLAALLALAVALPSVPVEYRYLPLVASAVLFGMPHGAVDYVALPRATTGRVTVRGVAVVVALYALLGGTYLLAWFLAPVPAAVGFVLLTWFHWGQGELYVLRDLFGVDYLDDWIQQTLTVLVRGGLPMLVPLLGFPERYRAVVATFVEPFGGAVGEWWLFEPGSRVALAGAFAFVTVIALARGRARATDRRGWRLDAAEVGLLWAVFLLVPPVLAVGVYFCLWHSVRHIGRVLLLDGQTVDALARREWLGPLGRFSLEAGVPTALALLGAASLWVVTAPSAETLAGATGVYLVAIAVLTLPHTAVVTILDREQGIWAWWSAP
jgi:Brp/Blh family beta-carotene 15,15'-monooxygenase